MSLTYQSLQVWSKRSTFLRLKNYLPITQVYLTLWPTLNHQTLLEETNWHNKSSSRPLKNKLFCNSPLNPLKPETKHSPNKFKPCWSKSNPSFKKPLKSTKKLQKSIDFKNKIHNFKPNWSNHNKNSKHYNSKNNHFLSKSKKSKKPFKNFPKSMNPLKPNCFKYKTINIKFNNSMNQPNNCW